MLAAGALFSLTFVVYASLVPLNYTAKPFDETVAEFQKTPWFQLGIERRADWVANGLMMLQPVSWQPVRSIGAGNAAGCC